MTHKRIYIIRKNLFDGVLGYSLESTMKANRVKPITGEVTDTLVFVRTNLINLPALKISWK